MNRNLTARQLDMSIDERMRQRLHMRRNDTAGRVLAWADWRRERFNDRGLEGLTGTAAVYHFDDAAQAANAAAHVLAGIASGFGPAQKQRAAIAMATIIRGYGSRYFRALTALEEALIESGITPALLAQLRDEREKFCTEFGDMLQAAAVMDRIGQGVPATREVVRMFIQEMEEIGDWLEMTTEHGRVPMLRTTLRLAQGVLDAVGKPTQ